jgi:hypothetical protein
VVPDAVAATSPCCRRVLRLRILAVKNSMKRSCARRPAVATRVGGGRKFGDGAERIAGQRAIVRSIHLVTSAAHADLWICGQRKRVAHRPTGSKNTSKRQFDCFGSRALKPGPSQPRPSARAAATPVAAFGIYPGRHSQALRRATGTQSARSTAPRPNSAWPRAAKMSRRWCMISSIG